MTTYWSYHAQQTTESTMAKTSVRIGAFELDDAELHSEQQGERTLSIPCKSDPDLCMQLSLIHISEPTRPVCSSRMPSSA